MSISARSITTLPNFRRVSVLRSIFAAAIFGAVAISAPSGAQAAMARPGAFDGTWNVTFATLAGNCSSDHTVPFNVSGTRLSSAGGGKVTGGISPSGNVSVTISVGASVASGSGRLAGNSGSGRWRGIITGDKCSGTWRATRG